MRSVFGWHRTAPAAAAAVIAYSAACLIAGLLRRPGLEPVLVVGEFAMAAGVGAWALGEGWWAAEELIIGSSIGVPSPADAGFLFFFPCVAMALRLHSAARVDRAADRLLMLSASAAIALSLMLLTWILPIAAMFDPSAPRATQAVALAYPGVGDPLVLHDLTMAATDRDDSCA